MQTIELPQTEVALVESQKNKGIAARRYNIPGDLVYKKAATLPDATREALLWLHEWAYRNDVPYDEIGSKLQRDNGRCYDGNTVWKVLTGRHEANLDKFAESVAVMKKTVEENEVTAPTYVPFIETSLSKMIFELCEAALIYQKITFIWGESQIGKTTTLSAFAAKNRGRALYVRVPEGGTLSCFMAELANVIGFSGVGSEKQLRKRIFDAITSNMLLIVDEITECFTSNGRRPVRTRTVNFIREIYDRKKCGVVVAGTNLVRDEFVGGASKKIIDQFRLRGLKPLQLPDKPRAHDLNQFAAHYGLTPASGYALELQNSVIANDSLGMWLTFLTAAARLSNKRGQKLAWEHVAKAADTFRRMENVK